MKHTTPRARNRKCSICPSWIEASARSPVLCNPCLLLLDTLAFKAESWATGQRPLPFNPFRTARTRASIGHVHGGTAGTIERLSDPDWIPDSREALHRIEFGRGAVRGPVSTSYPLEPTGAAPSPDSQMSLFE